MMLFAPARRRRPAADWELPSPFALCVAGIIPHNSHGYDGLKFWNGEFWSP